MSIFSKEYWKASLSALKDIRRLAFAALICALTVALDGLVRIPVLPGGLEIKFTFAIIALGCAVYGPAAGVLLAVVVDTLSFFLFPTGFAYFPGYMLTEILVSLFYSAFLYRQKITVPRLFCAKLCTNYLAHVLLNALWASMLMGKGYLYYFWSSLLKNTLMLPLEVLLLAAFFAATVPFFSKVGLLPHHSKADLSRLQFGKSTLPVFGLTALMGALGSLCFALTKAADNLQKGFLILSAALAGIGLVLLALSLLNRKKALDQ